MLAKKDKWARRGAYSLTMGAGAFFAYFNSKHQWVDAPEYNRFKGFWLEPFLPALEPYLPFLALVLGAGFLVAAAYCFRRYAVADRPGGSAA